MLLVRFNMDHNSFAHRTYLRSILFASTVASTIDSTILRTLSDGWVNATDLCGSKLILRNLRTQISRVAAAHAVLVNEFSMRVITQ